MALITWKQTFKKNGVIQKHAGVSVYFAGTTEAVRVLDVNGALRDDDPQVFTDSAGYAEFSLDSDDFASGQLFKIVAEPNAICQTCDIITLDNIMILQDTEGNRNFKNVFTQDAVPTEGMKEFDIWFETDDDNELHVYDGDNWVSRRDGSIATVAGDVSEAAGMLDVALSAGGFVADPSAIGVALAGSEAALAAEGGSTGAATVGVASGCPEPSLFAAG